MDGHRLANAVNYRAKFGISGEINLDCGVKKLHCYLVYILNEIVVAEHTVHVFHREARKETDFESAYRRT